MINKWLGIANEEDFNLSARSWFQITIIVAALTVVFIFCAGFVVLAQRDADTSQKVSQSFAPFFIGAMAAVTFCGAVWRGKLGSEQIRQQKRQNDAKDEENLATLLMDGTKLLGETKESHVLAGVAALEAVIVSPRAVFSTQAMDILVDLVEEVYKDTTKGKVLGAAVQAVNNGANLDRRSTRFLRLDYAGVTPNNAQMVNGVRMLAVKNATVDYFEFDKISNPLRVTFESCTFDDCKIEGSPRRFKNCVFQGGEILSMNARFLTTNRFESCNFSGAHFSGHSPSAKLGELHPFTQLSKDGNYFHSEQPITGGEGVKWGAILTCIAPMPD